MSSVKNCLKCPHVGSRYFGSDGRYHRYCHHPEAKQRSTCQSEIFGHGRKVVLPPRWCPLKQAASSDRRTDR